MAESIGQRPPLPPLSYLDTEKIKREHVVYNNNHAPVTTSLNMNAPPPPPPLTSPSTTYSGPPPPYSYPSSATSSSIGAREPAAVPPPPHAYTPTTDGRPGYTTEKDGPPAPTSRQSLPSISEALKGDQGMSISSLLSPTGSAPPTKPPYPAPNQSSPTSHKFVEAPPRRPTEPFSPHTSTTGRPYESYERSRPEYSPRTTAYDANRSPPTAARALDHPPRTAASPPLQARPPPVGPVKTQPPPSPVYHHYQLQNTPPTTAKYSQPPYQAPYSYPPTTSSVPGYPPTSVPQPTWRSGQAEYDHVKEVQRAARDSPGPRNAYGESVKRHLDIFDVETSLNEIADGSGRALDFARAYGLRAHQTQRSGPIPGSLPTLEECDDIMRQQQRVLDSMASIRELIVRQAQALAEQRIFDQRALKSAPSEADEESHNYMDKLEGAGGFAGPDAKKRRGRAAPPGRCHSCNRAETPEWRRGPDGARTLCNACGLHYAKLQRKMDSKDSGAGPSKLRPKESSEASP